MAVARIFFGVVGLVGRDCEQMLLELLLLLEEATISSGLREGLRVAFRAGELEEDERSFELKMIKF